MLLRRAPLPERLRHAEAAAQREHEEDDEAQAQKRLDHRQRPRDEGRAVEEGERPAAELGMVCRALVAGA